MRHKPNFSSLLGHGEVHVVCLVFLAEFQQDKKPSNPARQATNPEPKSQSSNFLPLIILKPEAPPPSVRNVTTYSDIQNGKTSVCGAAAAAAAACAAAAGDGRCGGSSSRSSSRSTVVVAVVVVL